MVLGAFGNEPVFDIARIESTRPDGSRESFSDGGKEYFGLTPAYTNDGGHLNATGQKKVASHLATFLAEVLEKKQETK